MIMDEPCSSPSGELILRTAAMPADTNANGDIFGGWILSQMDLAGGILAKEVVGSAVVTVAVESMKFLKPVQVGDVVCCYGEVVKKENTSLTLRLEVWVKPVLRQSEETCSRFQVTEANFIYVAIDREGKKRVFSS